MPYPVLWLGGLADPFVREMRETAHQFAAPFVMDSSAATTTSGSRRRRWTGVVDEMVSGLRAPAPAAR